MNVYEAIKTIIAEIDRGYRNPARQSIAGDKRMIKALDSLGITDEEVVRLMDWNIDYINRLKTKGPRAGKVGE